MITIYYYDPKKPKVALSIECSQYEVAETIKTLVNDGYVFLSID